jgi:hypothetical protein
VIADELRRMKIEGGFRAGGVSTDDLREFYATYAQSLVRLVQTKTRAPWLGNRTRGYALADSAPPQVFVIPESSKWKAVKTMRGTFQVKALDAAVPLGALPLDVARQPIVDALQAIARSDRYESWLMARERQLDDQAVCRRDVQPDPGFVDLTDYLPFLAAD